MGKRSTIACIYMGALLVSVVVWWHTTKIHRAPLPNAAIDELSRMAPMTVPLSIEIVRLRGGGGGPPGAFKDDEHFVQVLRESRPPGVQPALELDVNVDERVADEPPGFAHDDTDDAVDAALGPLVRPQYSFTFFLLERPDPDPSAPWRLLRAGRQLHGWVFADGYKNVDAALQACARFAWERLIPLVGAPDTKSPAGRDRSIRLADSYRVSVSVLDEDPSSRTPAHSRALSAIGPLADAYFGGILNALAPLPPSPSTPRRVLRHVHWAREPTRDEALGGYVFEAEHLPFVLDANAWNLDSALTLDPPVHFVAFVPSAARSPLHLRLPGGRLSAEGAFLVPGWGGLALAHVPNGTDPESEARAALRSAMPIFVGQLRLLLGLPPLDPALSPYARSDAPPPAPPARLLTCPETAICDWEIDVLARGRAAAAAAAAAASLRSLTALVDQQKNMVVGDHIRNLCDLAVEQLRDARAAVASLDPRAALSAALSAARRALVASRDAFFDPTMLGMMYFPDEHKVPPDPVW
eukprot:tig00000269_g23741.t1